MHEKCGFQTSSVAELEVGLVTESGENLILSTQKQFVFVSTVNKTLCICDTLIR